MALTKEEREHYEKKFGQIWETNELIAEFEVESFLAPFVFVKKRSSGRRGTLQFEHSPRFYFNFVER